MQALKAPSKSTPIKEVFNLGLRDLIKLLISIEGPQSRTLQPVRGEGYKPTHKSKANAETHPRLGVGGCSVSEG